jgi:hypothetical protein
VEKVEYAHRLLCIRVTAIGLNAEDRANRQKLTIYHNYVRMVAEKHRKVLVRRLKSSAKKNDSIESDSEVDKQSTGQSKSRKRATGRTSSVKDNTKKSSVLKNPTKTITEEGLENKEKSADQPMSTKSATDITSSMTDVMPKNDAGIMGNSSKEPNTEMETEQHANTSELSLDGKATDDHAEEGFESPTTVDSGSDLDG